MDTLPTIDYAGAVAAYTPWIIGILQVLKQSPKIDNAKLPYYAVILGLIMALAGMAASGNLSLSASGLHVDPLSVFKAIIEGTFGGSAGPAIYEVQKALPIALLTPGPDNYVAPPVKPPETSDNPKP